MLECIYHGHSFIELRSKKGSILIDPFIVDNPKCDITLEHTSSMNVQAIVVTHGHFDHIGDSVLIAQQHPLAPLITIKVLDQYLKNLGAKNSIGCNIGETYTGSFYNIEFIPASHNDQILETELKALPAGILIDIENFTIHHAGDTQYMQENMELLASRNINVSFLPIGGTYTMDVSGAILSTKAIKPTLVVPIHYNTRSKIKADDMEFAREVMINRYAVPKVLKPSQSIVLS